MERHRIFLSWSKAGSASHQVAQILYDYLPLLHDSWNPFLSSESIKAGLTWATELFEELETSHFGILCITPQSCDSSWLLFEAGALAKSFSTSRVIPLLIDLEPSQLPSPLKSFQAIGTQRSDFDRLIDTIGDSCSMSDETVKIIKSRLNVYWKDINEAVKRGAAIGSEGRKDQIVSTSENIS